MKLTRISFNFVLSISLCLTVFAARETGAQPIKDAPFPQEYRAFHPNPAPGGDDVAAIVVDGAGRVWTATRAGIFVLEESGWRAAMDDANAGPAFAAAVDAGGTAWFGAWNGLYHARGADAVDCMDGIDAPIGALAGLRGGGVAAMGPAGLWRGSPGDWTHAAGGWANSPRAIAEDETGALWVATGHGLFRIEGVEATGHWWDAATLHSSDVSGLAFGPDGRLYIGGLNGIDLFEHAKPAGWLSPADGLPCRDVRALRFDEDGTLWAATALGVARHNPEHPACRVYPDQPPWSLRHSLRWLPSDDARDVAFGADGTAWVATGGGVSAIRRREMTLAEKERHFHAITMARKVREPGLVESTRLMTPGDVSTSVHEDDDNDGEYTNLYLVMEAMRYAVTRDPAAKANAQRAFDAIEFLQEVTNTSGFIARTVVPESWAGPDNPNPHRLHDRNRAYTDRERAAGMVADPRNKTVEVRWRPAGKNPGWLWKGDTSSDEITGHYFGYLFYYDLVAETDAEKEQARALVRRVTDYLMEGGYNLIDPIDGTHTRWGVWAPDRLNGDMDWLAERNINSLELLSYLKAAHHITGDAKYDQAYRELIEVHGYAEACRAPRRTEPAMFTHIDDDLLVLAFPALILYEDDPALKAIYQEGLRQWFSVIEHEYSPLFSFMAGWLGIEDIHAEACVNFLRDTPIDLVEWTVDNTWREDVRLVRRPELEHWQLDRLLPPSERGVMRWDKNPWFAVRGAGGHIESSGVYYLLPYWLGRYAGYIAAP